MLTHIMEDLEPLGTAPGCIILSIGLAAFHVGPPRADLADDGFYTVVNVASQEKLGLHKSLSTVKWWDEQSADAREVLDKAHSKDAPSIQEALEMRNGYIRSHMPSVCVWGNGADFDNAIMAALYHTAGVKAAQGAFQGRCYRTVKNMAKHIKMQRTGTHHNALDDARSQALHLIEIVQRTGFQLS